MVEKTEMGHFWPSLYEPFRSFGTRLADWLSPASEASGDGKAYVLSMELPGVDDADVDVTVDDGVVTIRGEKKTQEEKKGDTWYFSERQYGAFRRSFRLPEDADGDAVTAEMKDGVLTVRVAKTELPAPEKARKIDIAKA